MSPDVRAGGVARLVVTRANGDSLAHAVADVETLAVVVQRLAPHVPHDAVWQVVDG